MRIGFLRNQEKKKVKNNCIECGSIAVVKDNKTLYCVKHYMKKGYHYESQKKLRCKEQTKTL